jgi:hypothetical protein
MDCARKWEPDPYNMYYWRPNVPRELTIDAFMRAYGTLGYVECADGTVEPGFEKIALYGKQMPWGDIDPTHAARQLPDRRWTSKLGPAEDITHATPTDVDGPEYGTCVRFLRRPARS